MIKTYADTFIFSRTRNYQNAIIDMIMKADRIDTSSKEFTDIKYQVKTRQVSGALYELLDKHYIVLLDSPTPMSKAFKVFTAKDLRYDPKKLKIFVDVSGLLTKNDMGYKINNIDTFISYLVTAAVNFTYFDPTKRLSMNYRLKETGAEAFSSLFTYILNYLYKINLLENKRDTCTYLACLYYLKCIVGSEDETSNKQTAKKLSRISDRQIEIIDMNIREDSFDNIDIFIKTLSGILKLDKLTTDVFIEKWIYLFGTGTHFGTEFFPSFSAILTDTYIGSYINNQHTIEKVTSTSMVNFSKEIIRVISTSISSTKDI